MPGLDKTGPMGQGAQTGRRLGRCNAALNEEKLTNYGRRRGRGFKNRNQGSANDMETGWGRGKGRGRGRGFGRLEN